MADAYVPTNYPTIETACRALRPLHEASRVIIQAGHRPTRGMILDGGDYSHIVIMAQDPVVYLSDSFVGVAEDSGSGTPGYVRMTDGLIYGFNTRMPTIDVLFDMRNAHQDGIYIERNSSIIVRQNKGVLNAGRHGIQLRRSELSADSLVVRGANGCGIRAQQTSLVQAPDIDADGCCRMALTDPEEGDVAHAAVFISRGSTAYVNYLKARDSGGHGMSNHRSWVSVQGAFLNRARLSALRTEQGGHTIASSSDCRASRSFPISFASGGSGYIDKVNVKTFSSTRAIHMSGAGVVVANDVQINNNAAFSNIPKNTITTNGILISNNR